MRFPGFASLKGPDTKVEFPQHIYAKMLAYAKASPGEISGWGKTKVVEDEYGDKVATIVDIRLFKQTVMSVHTSLNGEALTHWYIDMATNEPKEDLRDWNLWWHSHNTMPVFFSTTDDTAILKLKSPCLYSVCINKDGLLTARLDTDRGKTTQEVPISIVYEVDRDLQKACAAEVKAKVTFDEPTIYVQKKDPEIKKAVQDYIERFKASRNRGWGGAHVDL